MNINFTCSEVCFGVGEFASQVMKPHQENIRRSCIFPHLIRNARLNDLKQQLCQETIRKCKVEIKKASESWQCISATFELVLFAFNFMLMIKVGWGWGGDSPECKLWRWDEESKGMREEERGTALLPCFEHFYTFQQALFFNWLKLILGM